MTNTLEAPPTPPMSTSVVAARAVGATKRYGSGDTAVTALDAVTVDFRAHEFTAIMGPSGSGKSTLMHLVAGLDTLTSGSVFIGDTDLSRLDDRRLTHLRRDKIGFIFQAFNLIPTLTAIENITLPMSLAGRKPDAQWLDNVVDTVGLSRPARSPTERALRRPATARRRGPCARRAGPRSSSATNRPATSTPAPVPRSSRSCAVPSMTSARPS